MVHGPKKAVRPLLLRKCLLVVLVVLFSLVNIYFRKGQSGDNYRAGAGGVGGASEVTEAEEDSFYFVADDDQQHQDNSVGQEAATQSLADIAASLMDIQADTEPATESTTSPATTIETLLDGDDGAKINEDPFGPGFETLREKRQSRLDNYKREDNYIDGEKVESLPTPVSRRRRRSVVTLVRPGTPSEPSFVSTSSDISSNQHQDIERHLSAPEAVQSDKKRLRRADKDEGKGSKNLTNIADQEKPHTRKKQKIESANGSSTTSPAPQALSTMKPLINIVPAKKNISCEMPAYLEFPPDIFGQYLRTRGFIIVHFAVVCYMFYCLAVVCDNYFLPALEQCAQRLHLSEDVAGATFMAAGSSAPELFTALLGVFIAKGDVGTGTIVGSAVFNILFVIGLCGIFTAATQLSWWPVARDCTYYAFTVLVLIVVIYDGEVTTFESSVMLILYVVYIIIMAFNERLRALVVSSLPVEKLGLVDRDETGAIKGTQAAYNTFVEPAQVWATPPQLETYLVPSQDLYQMSMFEAACRVIIRHQWLFRSRTRFRAAANLVLLRMVKQRIYKKQELLLRSGPSKADLKRSLTAIRQDTVTQSGASARKTSMAEIMAPENFWQLVPNPTVEGWWAVVKWCLGYPLHSVLYYTVPDCRKKPILFLATFFLSVLWTAIFSYVMVWMVTLIGYTFGIPDSVMGITFLAAGTSIPDAYASIHVARAGQGDMAVSNSIGSNVFDILVGLALPWFIETAVVYPGTIAEVKSMGLAYAVVLLFVTLLITIFLLHIFKWTLNPKLGISLLVTYAGFLVISVALEFNLLGQVNPPMCDV